MTKMSMIVFLAALLIWTSSGLVLAKDSECGNLIIRFNSVNDEYASTIGHHPRLCTPEHFSMMDRLEELTEQKIVLRTALEGRCQTKGGNTVQSLQEFVVESQAMKIKIRKACDEQQQALKRVKKEAAESAARKTTDNDPGDADAMKCIAETALNKLAFHQYKKKIRNTCKTPIDAIYLVCDRGERCREETQHLPAFGEPMFPVAADLDYPKRVRAAFQRR